MKTLYLLLVTGFLWNCDQFNPSPEGDVHDEDYIEPSELDILTNGLKVEVLQMNGRQIEYKPNMICNSGYFLDWFMDSQEIELVEGDHCEFELAAIKIKDDVFTPTRQDPWSAWDPEGDNTGLSATFASETSNHRYQVVVESHNFQREVKKNMHIRWRVLQEPVDSPEFLARMEE